MFLRVVNHCPECFRQRRAGAPQFIPVQDRKLMQQALAMRRELHQHFAAVLIAMAAFHGAMIDETVYQFYGAVMAKA